MQINFSLTPLEFVQPWGGTDRPSHHWFGLTDGQYWIDVGTASLFEYSTAVQERFGTPRYCQYQVSRLHEDLLEIVPAILDPVPTQLIGYLHGETRDAWDRTYRRWFDDGESAADKDEFWRLADAANTWINNRSLDTGYLSPGTNIRFWSDEASVYVAWDNSGRFIDGLHAWHALAGVHHVSRAAFVNELHSFHDRLMAAMQIRIEQVRAGALPREVHVDLDSLAREQHQREQGFRDALTRSRIPAEWKQVTEAIRSIEAKL
ncbi:MAG: hypothetical protein JNM43_09435 [Planctomycetaceae bacterium]|nr:hypothetical protein [Planctomycetaceae bacterium]